MNTADIVDANDDDVDFCNLPFLKIGKRRSFYGPIQTVKCFEDNVLLKAELQKQGDERVLVVDGGGSTRLAILGDMIASLIIKNNWAGVILNGAVRDVAILSQMNIGIRCLGTSTKKSIKLGAGQLGVSIQFGGATFKLGDWVYCDEDGVLVSETNIIGNI